MTDKIIGMLEENGIDGLLIYDIFNVRYLSGYTSDDAYLLITKNKNYFLTDPRYTEQAGDECPGFEVLNWRGVDGGFAGAVSKIVKDESIDRLGIESHSITLSYYNKIAKDIKAELIPLEGIVEEIRSIKKPEEVEYSRKACEIGDRAFNRIIKEIKVGKTEKELSALLAYFLKIEGSDARNYENILISGPRTSLLHGIPSERKVKEGDIVLMDFGAGYKGYLSDMSRTLVLGKPSEKQKEVFEIAQQSEQDMIDAVKAGATGQELYEASLKVMKNTEYFDYHYSGVGHGVGLAVHETPFLGPNSKNVLKTNNIITLEPGIYIPEWGGMRVEDQVLVTEDGCEVLTNSPRHLLEL
jgi:Xaa-Pro aminopeptidase